MWSICRGVSMVSFSSIVYSVRLSNELGGKFCPRIFNLSRDLSHLLGSESRVGADANESLDTAVFLRVLAQFAQD